MLLILFKISEKNWNQFYNAFQCLGLVEAFIPIAVRAFFMWLHSSSKVWSGFAVTPDFNFRRSKTNCFIRRELTASEESVKVTVFKMRKIFG